MPITRHKSGAYLFQFNRVVPGVGRQRSNKVLPKAWTKQQALEYERVETARLYAIATGVTKQAHLIEDAVLLYLQEHAPTLKNFKDLQSAFALCHPWYQGKPLNTLPEIARKYASDNAGTLSAGTIRNRLAYLRAACRWAWKAHNMGEHDPAERMVLPKGSKPRQVYFGRLEMLQTARKIKNPLSRRVFKVAFYTGLRLSEVLRSKPVMAGGLPAFMITDSKNDTPHIVPANPRIAHLLRSAEWPPKIHKTTVSHHTKAAMIATGIGYSRFHDTRHSAASEMINAGVDLNTVGDVLNHKSTASTKVYAHLVTAKLSDAVAKIGRKMQPTPAKKTG